MEPEPLNGPEAPAHPGVLARVRGLAPDVGPLRSSRDFRLLCMGEGGSFFGSMVTYVAVPYQVYRLTHSSLDVGLLGVAELVPLVVVALLGGALADAVDRRKVAFGAELGLMAISALLALNALVPRPQLWALYVLAGLASGCSGLGRPSLGAMIPRIVEPAQMAAAVSLQALIGTAGLIAGPALGGLLLGTVGLAGAYLFDTVTFLASLTALRLMAEMPPPEDAASVSIAGVLDGIRYLKGRPVLQGTYIIDTIAMVFGMPKALFPALALTRFAGGPGVLGLL